jgi:LacI family transcriptional regulator
VVSIADVAKAAGVSPTTVSHALSGKRKVSPDIVSRVREAMDRLGYQPSRTAQNLARGTTRILAVAVPDIGNSYFAELAKGVEATAIGRGYNVILCTTGFDLEKEMQYLEMIRSRAVDGIVYSAGSPPTNSELHRVLGDMPLVFVDEEIVGTDFPSVVSDNDKGARLVARHLLDLGHRKALLLVMPGNNATSIRRIEGFQDVWGQGGGDFAIVKSDLTEQGGRKAVLPHIEALRSGEVTAIFALNDFMAIGAINQLRKEGIDVPGQVSVVGFDDVSAGSYCYPPLTTVRQNVLGLGVAATTTLIDSLEGVKPLTGEQVVLPVELILRESTGPRRI